MPLTFMLYVVHVWQRLSVRDFAKGIPRLCVSHCAGCTFGKGGQPYVSNP